MRASAIIGVPLTLLQLGVHRHTGVTMDAWTVANNFAVCAAVYGADRLDPALPSLARARLPSRLAAVASTAFYASDPSTAWLAPAVPVLHVGYADLLKPAIAPIKPFFVAALWTVAIYDVPAWRAHHAADLSLAPAAALFLTLASLSHAADVLDADEDAAASLATPAVVLGTDQARAYAIALALGAACVHQHIQADAGDLLFDALGVLAAAVVSGAAPVAPTAVVAVALTIAVADASARAHDFEVLAALLRSSDATHGWALAALTSVTDGALDLDEPWRSLVIDATLRLAREGDAVGSAILRAYEAAVLDELRPP